MDDIKVNVTATDNVVEIRTGEALPLKEPNKVALSGVLTCVGDFVDKRKDTIKPLAAHVVANYTQRTIELVTDEDDHYYTTVSGTLAIYPELEKLHINADRTYDEKELMRKLNFFGRWFEDKDAFISLLKKLQQFKAKIQQDFTNADDYKGTAAVEKLTKIEHTIPLEFVLNIPIFTGQPPRTFKVNICVGARDGGVSFWLESVEMHELISKETDELFEKELARLSEYVIIKQW